MKHQRASEQAASALPARFNEQMWQENDRRWWLSHAHLFVDPECKRTIIYLRNESTHEHIGREVSALNAGPLKALWGWLKPHKQGNEDRLPLSDFYAQPTDPNATQPIVELVEV